MRLRSQDHTIGGRLCIKVALWMRADSGERLEWCEACTWLRDFLTIFRKIAVRQTVGDCGAAEGNSKSCKPFSPTP